MNVSVSSPAGTSLAALQWKFTYPSTVTNVAVSAGIALTAASKSLTCATVSGGAVCVASGMNSTSIANGTIATFTANISGTSSITIGASTALGSSPGATSMSVATTGATVTLPPPTVVPSVVSVSPSSGSGTSQTFSFTFSDSAGAQDMVWQQVYIAGSSGGVCSIYYSPAARQVYLAADNGTTSLGPLTLGSSGSLQNSQCVLNAGASSASTSGNTLTLNLALSFQSSFDGTRNIWAAAASADGLNSGWQMVGSWTPSTPTPTVVSVTPSSGSGSSQAFSFVFSDAAGYRDMVWQQILISSSGSMAGSCYLYYSLSNNAIYLENDSGTGGAGAQTLGTSGTLQNSQCTLNVGASSAVGSAGTLTLTLALSFQPSFAGTQHIWAAAGSADGLNSGWQLSGSWTTSSPVPSVVSVTPSSGSGFSQSFSFVFSDPAGYRDMVWQQVMMSGTGSMAGACNLFYSPSTNVIYLTNDAGTGTVGSQTLGIAGTLQNNQCSLNTGSSSATGSGNTLTLNLALTFQASFSGAKSIWVAAASSDGLNSGWQLGGTWTP